MVDEEISLRVIHLQKGISAVRSSFDSEEHCVIYQEGKNKVKGKLTSGEKGKELRM